MTEENLTPYIPIGTLFKYLLKDYRRERQRTIHMEAQISRLHQAVSCRNNTIEQLRNENARLKNELDTYLLFLGKI